MGKRNEDDIAEHGDCGEVYGQHFLKSCANMAQKLCADRGQLDSAFPWDESREIIWAGFDYLTKSKLVRDRNNFVLVPSIATEVISRCRSDEKRIKISHPRRKSLSPSAICGYLTYWIARLKPIAILEDKPTEDEMFINEYSAIYVALGLLSALSCAIQKQPYFFPPQVEKWLRYTLRYRITTGDTISIIYENSIQLLKQFS